MTKRPSKFKRRKNDLYETERYGTRAFTQHFPVKGMRIWECAAGNHMMADALREEGAALVFTSDIKVYNRQHHRVIDFTRDIDLSFMQQKKIDAIITNPPYGFQNRLAAVFLQLALDRCDGLVAMLLDVGFDSGKTRQHLLGKNPRFAAKIVLMDRLRWFEDSRTDGTSDHAWFVFFPKGKKHNGPRLLYSQREKAPVHV